MDQVKNAGKYVSETVQGAVSGTSKEANKQVAKDSNASTSTRLQAGKEAVFDKKDELVHDNKADYHKEAAQH